MPAKKIKSALTRKRKLTYKELEWDYMPIIVLFAAVTGILTLLLILLAVYQDILAQEELDRIKRFRFFDHYINQQEVATPTPELEWIQEDFPETEEIVLDEELVFEEEL